MPDEFVRGVRTSVGSARAAAAAIPCPQPCVRESLVWCRAGRLDLASGLHAGLADGALLAQLGATSGLARLFVILALAEFLLNSATLEQLLETAQGQGDRLSVVNAHP